jgi:hypothetical protein
MTAKTRYFMFGSVLVLVVGLSIGLVAYYGGVPSGLFNTARGPEELKYVPAGAAIVAYANVRDVMGSQLRQRLRHIEGVTDEGRNEFRDKTGIDIERDIDHVVAFMQPKAAGGEGAGLVLARGQFDQSRIETLVQQQGATIETYKGKHLIMAPETDRGDRDRTGRHHGDLAVAFLGADLVAVGNTASVKGALDSAGAASSVLGNAEMMKLVGEMTDASMWAVGRFDALSAEAKLPGSVAEKIPALTWFSASGHVNGGIQANVKAEAKDEQAADNLRDIIRGFTALIKLQAGSSAKGQKMLPDIQLGGDGKVVSLSFTVTSDMLDAITAGKAAAKALKKVHSKTVDEE